VRITSGKKKMIRIEVVQRLLVQARFFAICNKFFSKKSIEKRFKLFQLRGFNKLELEEYARLFYAKQIKPNLIIDMYQKFQNHLSNADEIVLISGGYSIYLKYFLEEFNLSRLFSSEIEFDRNNLCTGFMTGMDCLYENKVTFIERNGFERGMNTVAYSDSITDLPLLKWVNKGYVVSRNVSQKWASQFGFSEIVWKN
jgi:HAD superfamily phosphoserine phosphatase-like hydrolase